MTLFSYEPSELENKKCPCGTGPVRTESYIQLRNSIVLLIILKTQHKDL